MILKTFKRFTDISEIKIRLFKLGNSRFDRCAKSFRIIKPESYISLFFSFHKLYGALCLYRFFFKGPDTVLYFNKHVVYARKVIDRLTEISFGFVLLETKLCNSRGILKYTSAFLAFS